ncbi:neprilysin-1-like [Haemaphysalis longicornis]
MTSRSTDKVEINSSVSTAATTQPPLTSSIIATQSLGCDSSISTDCVEARDLFQVSLNTSYRPCDDFFGYVCSTSRRAGIFYAVNDFMKSATMAALYSIDVPPSGQDASQKAAGMFRACTDLGLTQRSEVSALKTFTKRIGVDISNLSVPSNFAVADALVRLAVEYGFPTYVSIGTYWKRQEKYNFFSMRRYAPDINWISVTAPSLQQKGELDEFFQTYLSNYDQSINVTEYKTLIGAAEAKLVAYIRNLETEERNKKRWPVYVALRNFGNVINKTVTSGEWLRMIRLYTNHTFWGSHWMICWDNGPLVMQYMIDSAGIGTNDSRLLIGWSLLRRLMHLASGSLMAKMYPLKIENFCFDTALEVMEIAVMNVYFKKYLPESALKKAERMAKLIHDQLKIKMNQTTWIQGDFRSLVSKKAAQMGVYVGYPPYLAAPGSIDRHFAMFPQTGKTFFSNYVEAHKRTTGALFKYDDAANFTVGQPNAFYDAASNYVALLAGILQPPLFYSRGVSAVDFGGLGQVIGHEMMHAFDVDGITVDAGATRKTLTNATTIEQFQQKVECLRKAYEAVEAEPRVQFPRLSNKYDSEGLVDMTGLWLAYSAYRALPPAERDAVIPGLPLTAEQLFFVAHCYKWCGSSTKRDPKGDYWATRSRCSLPLRQMAEFATAFNCRPGDRMNPSSRCTFFS